MIKYPIGLQDFESIINDNYLYIDKTHYLLDICKERGYYFLSRPRRFGKSILINTIKSLFEGKKDLFKGLYIYDNWDWTKKNPVIKVSFAEISYNDIGIEKALKKRLTEIAIEYTIELENKESIGQIFRELIIKIASKYDKAVVLIDEYDKAITHYLGHDIDQAKANKDVLRSFFSILKDADAHLRFVFLTGVSKFSKVSIFSDLNNLNDLTLDHRFSGICGITQYELEERFQDELQNCDINKLKTWYNGYTWDLKTMVYNPFSLLNFFQKNQYQNYWFESGTPTFLVNLAKQQKLYDFDNKEASAGFLSSFDLENLSIQAIMFQTGYLTFKSYDETSELYTLGYPNQEVKKSYLEYLINGFNETKDISGAVWSHHLQKALREENFELVKTNINSLFKSVPYTLWQNENESFFHAILHLCFKLIGIQVESEVMTSDGRVDSIVKFDDKIFALEFKLDGDAKNALEQIKEKKYLQPYFPENKKLIALGINFSKSKKQVEDMAWEIIDNK